MLKHVFASLFAWRGAPAPAACSLRFDRKPRGGSGLALHVPLPELGLVVGDRLEPSDSLHDVGKLRDAEVPLDVVFWRRSEESLCRHRNPLLTADVGLSTDKALTVDTLHALYLGVMLVYCRVTVWVVLHSGVYGHGVGGEAGLVPAVLAIRHALFGFYDRRHAALPEENLTRVSDMVPAMLGTSADPKLKTKGAETWGFLFFLLDELRRWGAKLGAEVDRLLRAGEALVQMVLLWRGCGWVVPDHIVQDVKSLCGHSILGV